MKDLFYLGTLRNCFVALDRVTGYFVHWVRKIITDQGYFYFNAREEERNVIPLP